MEYTKQNCRLCFKREVQNMTMISEHSDIEDKIKTCLDINIGNYEVLPDRICLNCLKKLDDFHAFKEFCKMTDKVLQGAMETNSLHLVLQDDKVCSDYAADSEGTPFVKGEIDSDYEIIIEVTSDDDTNNVKSDETLMETLGFSYKSNDGLLSVKEEIMESNEEEMYDYHEDSTNDSTENEEVPRKSKKYSERVKCPVCSKAMLQASLKLHMIKHTDRFKCSHCQTRCSSRANLWVHMKSFHTTIKDHFCTICGKGFTHKALLKIHSVIHTDQRPFKCKHCDYKGRTMSALRTHNLTHQTSRPYLCDLCPKTFRNVSEYRIHKRFVHVGERKFICDICGSAQASNYKLKTHMFIHTGDRPYKCEMCEKSFKRSDALSEHKRSLEHQRNLRKFESDESSS